MSDDRHNPGQFVYQAMVNRVQRIIQSPAAQSSCRAIIFQVAEDNPTYWNEMIDDIELHNGVATSRLESGGVLVTWDRYE